MRDTSPRPFQHCHRPRHDHHQWCRRAVTERDLREIAPYWQAASDQALADAEIKLASLLDHLEKKPGVVEKMMLQQPLKSLL